MMAFTIVGSVLAGLSMLYAIYRWVRRIGKGVRRIAHFFDDWAGEEARPGVPGRPGVMKRLEDIQVDLSKIKHELWPNHGGSLRDAVDRLEKANGGKRP